MLHAAPQALAHRLGPRHGLVAVVRVGELADREGAEAGDAFDCAHPRGTRLHLAVGADVAELERAYERVEGVLVVARLAAERGERLGVARRLHALDRLRRELTDLAPQRAQQELLERSHARRRDLRVLEGLAEQTPRRAELPALEELVH